MDLPPANKIEMRFVRGKISSVLTLIPTKLSVGEGFLEPTSPGIMTYLFLLYRI